MASARVIELPLAHPLRCVAVRPAPRSASSGGGARQQEQAQQVLLFTEGGCFELLGLGGAREGGVGGAGDAAGVRVGPAVPLRDVHNAEWSCDTVRYAIYDAGSQFLYATTEDGLVQIDAAGSVTVPAFDGDWLPFDINGLQAIAVDRLGVVYASTYEGKLCLLLLPSRRAEQVAGTVEEGAAVGGLIQLTSANVDGDEVKHVVYDPCIGRLYVTTYKAIYHVHGTTATVFAGSPNEVSDTWLDGVGSNANFSSIRSVVTGHDGCLYVVDCMAGTPSFHLRKVTPEGVVSTMQQVEWDDRSPKLDMVLLPHGWLALFDEESSLPCLLQLGLQLPSIPSLQSKLEAAAALSRHEDLAVLAADLAALLTADPGATSDVTVRVGGTDFPAHRAILSARCPYFERHFATLVGEASRGPIVELPDADPAACRHVLSYIYSVEPGDWADVEMAQDVAELADRLLLPKLRDEALRRLVAAVQVATVLPALGWAERTGFSGAVYELLGFYADHQAEVLEQEGEAMEQLMGADPKLAMRVMRTGAKLAVPRAEKVRHA